MYKENSQAHSVENKINVFLKRKIAKHPDVQELSERIVSL